MHGLTELLCRGVRLNGEGKTPTCVVRLLQFLAVARTFAVPVAARQMPLPSVFMILMMFSLAQAFVIIICFYDGSRSQVLTKSSSRP